MIGLTRWIAALLLTATPALADTPSVSDEARTAAYMDSVAASPPRLRLFLQEMPKGGDLHNHAGGANFAEDYLRWAAADGLCLMADSYKLVEPPCEAPGRIPAAGLERDYPRYAAAINAFSTRGFEAGTGDPTVAGYDRFFSTFERFGAAYSRHVGEALTLARRQAAADHVSYLELSSGSRVAAELAAKVGGADAGDLNALYTRIAPLLPDAVRQVTADYDSYDAEMAQADGCGGTTPAPPCDVAMRYLFTALRTMPPAQVFVQLSLAFAMADTDPRFVGVNIAAPEHDPIAIRDYRLHMAMIAFLKARYPKVKLSLHAGELSLGLVPSRDLAFHIQDAVAVAGASRIGHGVDISYERDAPVLLKRMARDRVAVEINLTSNAVILGVKGATHPLSLYREAGVPVVLSTDDEGVSRSDMTNEYLRAVTEQALGYRDLKQIARDGLQYAFLQGPSLWRDRAGGAMVAACASPDAPTCKAFLATSPKAERQWRLERELKLFEAKAR